jgi:anti-sigma factor RsiW
MSISDETIMTYADGELDAAGCSALELAMLSDPVLAAKVAQQQALGLMVFGAFAPVLNEALPERLTGLLQASPATATNDASPKANANAKASANTNSEPYSDPIDQLKAARQARQEADKKRADRLNRWSLQRWLSLAATLVVGVMLGRSGIFAPSGTPAITTSSTSSTALVVSAGGALTAQGTLATALSQQLASAPVSDSGIRIGVSFVAQDGVYCRSFALDGAAGLACRDATQWKIPLMVDNKSVAQTDSYQQAATAIPPVVLDAIDQRIAGMAMDAAEERRALERGWKP